LLCIGSDIVLYDTKFSSNDVHFPLKDENYYCNGICFAGENDDIVAVAAVSGIIYLFSIKDGVGKQKIDQPIIHLNGQPKSSFLRYSREICVLASLTSCGKSMKLWSPVELPKPSN